MLFRSMQGARELPEVAFRPPYLCPDCRAVTIAVVRDRRQINAMVTEHVGPDAVNPVTIEDIVGFVKRAIEQNAVGQAPPAVRD